jgi:hypothetical protein
MSAMRSPRLGRMQFASALWGLVTAFHVLADTDIPRETELTLSGIQLADAQSAKMPFGMKPVLDDPDSDRPKAYICNQDQSERLALVYYEGDTAYVISEFRVEQVTTRYIDCSQPETPIEHFVSGKGIALGMQREQLARILGKPHHTHPQLDETVLIYRIDGKSASGFLQRYGAPAYFGQYHFREGRLVRFSFGFELP